MTVGKSAGVATEEWHRLLAEKLAKCGGDRVRAVQELAREKPWLREAMIEEANEAAGRR